MPDTPEFPDFPLRRRSTFRFPRPRSEASPTPTTEGVSTAPAAPATAMPDATGERVEPVEFAQPRHPRHRAERVRNRRAGARRTVAVGSAAAIVGLSAFGAVTASAEDHSGEALPTVTAATPTTPGASGSSAADTIDASQVDDAPVVTSDLSVAAAPFTGGTQITVAGEQLDEVQFTDAAGQPVEAEAPATELSDAQRDLVKVGDIAQFDWDSSGDRDHTAVVTRVERTSAGTKVWVGGHTKDIDYWDVDTALATGGGSVTYFSLR